MQTLCDSCARSRALRPVIPELLFKRKTPRVTADLYDSKKGSLIWRVTAHQSLKHLHFFFFCSAASHDRRDVDISDGTLPRTEGAECYSASSLTGQRAHTEYRITCSICWKRSASRLAGLRGKKKVHRPPDHVYEETVQIKPVSRFLRRSWEDHAVNMIRHVSCEIINLCGKRKKKKCNSIQVGCTC